MEVEYELTTEDLYAVQWRAAYESDRVKRARRKSNAWWIFLLLVLFVLSSFRGDDFVITGFNILAFSIVGLTFIVGVRFVERRIMRRHILELVRQEKPGGGQLGRHRVVVNDDGVLESTDVNESRHMWAGVDRIEQNSDYIFIYTSAIALHAIPKRAFRDGNDAESFYQLCKLKKEDATLSTGSR